MSNDPLVWFVLLIVGVPAVMMLTAIVSGFLRGIRGVLGQGAKMITVTADLSGLDRLIASLDGKGGVEIVRAMANEILAGAQEKVPVQTGDLKKTGHVEKRKGTSHAVVFGGKHGGARSATQPVSTKARPAQTGEKEFLRSAAMDKRRVLGAAAKAAKKVLARQTQT